MVDVPAIFRPIINTQYPPENIVEYERWFFENYTKDVSDREYLPILFCGYLVNNNYGQDRKARYDLQAFIDELPADKKYFVLSQYDDGVGVDWNGKDVLEFNMSKNTGYPLPLLCQPHSYEKKGEKKYLANFVGNRTHSIRDNVLALHGKQGYYVSSDPHRIDQYCRVIADSIFSLCPRGYGINSFRIAESMQYGTIPIYISDEFIFPHNIDFNEYGVIIKDDEVSRIDEIIHSISPLEIIRKQDRIRELYPSHFTYEGCRDRIIEYLINEKATNEQIYSQHH